LPIQVSPPLPLPLFAQGFGKSSVDSFDEPREELSVAVIAGIFSRQEAETGKGLWLGQ